MSRSRYVIDTPGLRLTKLQRDKLIAAIDEWTREQPAGEAINVAGYSLKPAQVRRAIREDSARAVALLTRFHRLAVLWGMIDQAQTRGFGR